jgi:hypothetical protein
MASMCGDNPDDISLNNMDESDRIEGYDDHGPGSLSQEVRDEKCQQLSL